MDILPSISQCICYNVFLSLDRWAAQWTVLWIPDLMNEDLEFAERKRKSECSDKKNMI